MNEQILILAEGAGGGGVSPFLIGGGMLLILVCLYGITLLTSGLNRPRELRHQDEPVVKDSRTEH